MKRRFCILLFFLTIQQTFAQKSYNLYGKSERDSIVVYEEYTVNEISNGIISIERLDQKVEGELATFSLKTATRTFYKKDHLEKTFLQNRTKFVANIKDRTMVSKDSSGLEGKTVLFRKDGHNNWTIPKFESCDYYLQPDLEEELRRMNDTLIKVKTSFDYPESMRIGDQFELKAEKMASFYEIKDIKEVQGALVLKEVINRDNDTIAIFDITVKMRGLVVPEDDAYMDIEMSGTVERLTYFYDREINLSGSLKMEGTMDQDEYLTMVIPVDLVMTQKIE